MMDYSYGYDPYPAAYDYTYAAPPPVDTYVVPPAPAGGYYDSDYYSYGRSNRYYDNYDDGYYGRDYDPPSDWEYAREPRDSRDRQYANDWDDRRRPSPRYDRHNDYYQDDYDAPRRTPSPPRRSHSRSKSPIVVNDTASRIDAKKAKATPSDAKTVKMKGFVDPRDDETATVASQRTVRTVAAPTHYVDKSGKKKKLTRKQLREMYELGVNQRGLFKGTLKRNSRARGVSTQAAQDDKVHYVAPYPLMSVPIHEARRRIEKIMLKELPDSKNTAIVRRKADYLRFEVQSKGMMGVIDDVEFYFSKMDGCIHCKSVSRAVSNDKNSNKERVARVWSKYRQDVELSAHQKANYSLGALEKAERQSQRSVKRRSSSRSRDYDKRSSMGSRYDYDDRSTRYRDSGSRTPIYT